MDQSLTILCDNDVEFSMILFSKPNYAAQYLVEKDLSITLPFPLIEFKYHFHLRGGNSILCMPFIILISDLGNDQIYFFCIFQFYNIAHFIKAHSY